MWRNYKFISLFFMLCGIASVAHAQKAERDYLRKGNRAYKDSLFTDAEIDYRKALDVNPTSTIAMYNLGNVLSAQNKQKEALETYIGASKIEKNKSNLASIYHNMGVIWQTQKEYAKALEAYKESLRNNPKDDETRYNLALVQKLLKNQQQQQNQQNEQQQDKQEKQEQEKNKEQNKQEQQKNEQQQQQQQNQDNKMSKENAEQLLNSVMQDEKNIQDKVKKQQVIQGGRLEKDW